MVGGLRANSVATDTAGLIVVATGGAPDPITGTTGATAAMATEWAYSGDCNGVEAAEYEPGNGYGGGDSSSTWGYGGD